MSARSRLDAAESEIASAIVTELRDPFCRGFGGPGGWWILVTPAVIVDGTELFPDLAGWRKAHLDALPSRGPLDVAPDWVCEIRSGDADAAARRDTYARLGVEHIWSIDVDPRTLTVRRLEDGGWVEVGAFGPDLTVLAAPFDAIELDVPAWWTDLPKRAGAPELHAVVASP